MKKLICLLLSLLTVIACFPVLAEQESKALVLYFDYSENIDTTGLDVDAISQASMAGTRARDNSNLLVMVDVLKERTNSDVYSLRVADLYAPDFGDMMGPAREQKENNEMPCCSKLIFPAKRSFSSAFIEAAVLPGFPKKSCPISRIP